MLALLGFAKQVDKEEAEKAVAQIPNISERLIVKQVLDNPEQAEKYLNQLLEPVAS